MSPLQVLRQRIRRSKSGAPCVAPQWPLLRKHGNEADTVFVFKWSLGDYWRRCKVGGREFGRRGFVEFLTRNLGPFWESRTPLVEGGIEAVPCARIRTCGRMRQQGHVAVDVNLLSVPLGQLVSCEKIA